MTASCLVTRLTYTGIGGGGYLACLHGPTGWGTLATATGSKSNDPIYMWSDENKSTVTGQVNFEHIFSISAL